MEQPWTREIWSFFPQFLGSPCNSAGVNYAPNSWNILLWSLFPQLLCSSSSLAMLNILKLVKTLLPSLFLQLLRSSSGSTRLNYPEPMKTSHTRIVHSITQWMKQLNRVKILQTHELFSYDLCSLNYSLVTLAGWNYPELIKYSPIILLTAITR